MKVPYAEEELWPDVVLWPPGAEKPPLWVREDGEIDIPEDQVVAYIQARERYLALRAPIEESIRESVREEWRRSRATA
jgi:hypothetical protein